MSDFAPVPTALRNPGRITVGVFPGDNHPVVLEMASTLGSSTAFSPFASFTAAALQQSGYRQSFTFPLDGRRRYFRARHEAAGWTAGAYTRTVSAIPRVLVVDGSTSGGWEWRLGGDPAPLSEAMMKGEGHLSASVSIDVGTPNVDSTTIEKKVSVPAVQFIPDSTDETYALDTFGRYAFCSDVTSVANLMSGVVLPPGVTLTEVSMSAARTSTAASVALNVYKIDAGDPSTFTVLATLTSNDLASTDVGGWFNVEDTSLSDTPTSDTRYALRATPDPSSTGGTTDAAFGGATLTYTMSQYEDAY